MPAGMAYVALLQCRTLAGLGLAGLTCGMIRADGEVLAFYARKE